MKSFISVAIALLGFSASAANVCAPKKLDLIGKAIGAKIYSFEADNRNPLYLTNGLMDNGVGTGLWQFNYRFFQNAEMKFNEFALVDGEYSDAKILGEIAKAQDIESLGIRQLSCADAQIKGDAYVTFAKSIYAEMMTAYKSSGIIYRIAEPKTETPDLKLAAANKIFACAGLQTIGSESLSNYKESPPQSFVQLNAKLGVGRYYGVTAASDFLMTSVFSKASVETSCEILNLNLQDAAATLKQAESNSIQATELYLNAVK
ncbi:MAG: hypothetical protein ACXVA9_04765 [Bdellovibrionales bacterium]